MDQYRVVFSKLVFMVNLVPETVLFLIFTVNGDHPPARMLFVLLLIPP